MPSLRARCALAVAIGAVVICVTIAMKARVLTTQDLYTHIWTGHWVLTHHSVPDRGIFSASMPDAPWVAHEWLAGVWWALLYDHFGWGGVVVGTGLLLAIAVGVVTAETSRTLGPFGGLAAGFLGWVISVNHIVARPHVATLALMVIWIAAHVRARERNTAPPLYLVPLMTLWVNVHGAFFFGLVMTAMFAGEALYESDSFAQARVAALRWGIFFGASVLAALVSPYGLTGILFPLQMISSLGPVLDIIGEWMPSSTENNAALIFWLLLMLFVALLTGIRLPICRLLMFLLLLYMAFAHRRHTELMGLATPLLLQHAIADHLTPFARKLARNWGPLALPHASVSLIAASLAVTSLVAFIGARHVVHGQDRFTPAAAVDAVLARGISGQVMHEQFFGGYLNFRGIPPLIDGRVDMYGRDFVLRYVALDQLTNLLKQYNVAWTLYLPTNAAVTVLDNLPGWRRFYADDYAVVHIRESVPAK